MVFMKKILSKKRALEIIKNFPRSRVLVVGDIMVDHFIWGKVARISPEAPVPVVEIQSDSLLLGGCANVLNNIFSLGGKFTGRELSVPMIWERGCSWSFVTGR